MDDGRAGRLPVRTSFLSPIDASSDEGTAPSRPDEQGIDSRGTACGRPPAAARNLVSADQPIEAASGIARRDHRRHRPRCRHPASRGPVPGVDRPIAPCRARLRSAAVRNAHGAAAARRSRRCPHLAPPPDPGPRCPGHRVTGHPEGPVGARSPLERWPVPAPTSGPRTRPAGNRRQQTTLVPWGRIRIGRSRSWCPWSYPSPSQPAGAQAGFHVALDGPQCPDRDVSRVEGNDRGTSRDSIPAM